MLADWSEQARRRIPEAIRQAWAIVVAVDPQNQVQAFRVTIGSDPLFATVKADRRARIQETAINAEALLPGGPYDLWRDDEQSRRVKDLVSAFAEQPRLPKMLRAQEILATIDRGVQDNLFVASLPRPDGSVKTWWRTPIDEAARTEPALELMLPATATLSDLDPNVLAPGSLPAFWTGESVTVGDLIEYFAGGRSVAVQREGYEEPVAIPACPTTAVETAVATAVERGVLRLVNGPASFQGEPLPAGVLTASATLRAPMAPLEVQRLMPDAVPDAWTTGEATVLALSVALAGQEGCPIPWAVLRRAIDDAITSRWLEVAPGSGGRAVRRGRFGERDAETAGGLRAEIRVGNEGRLHVVRGPGSGRSAGPERCIARTRESRGRRAARVPARSDARQRQGHRSGHHGVDQQATEGGQS